MAHIYENGTRAWQPDPTEGWVASEVVDKQIEGDKVKLVFQLETGEVRSTRRGGEGRRGEGRWQCGRAQADDAPRRKKPSRRP